MIRQLAGVATVFDGQLRVVEQANQFEADLLLRMARQNPAVDVDLGALRQRIDGVSAALHRGDAGGMQLGIVGRIF